MKRKRPTAPNLSMEHSDLAGSCCDMAVDYRKESFAQVANRVVLRGFGKTKTLPAFKKEARKMYDLAGLIAERSEGLVWQAHFGALGGDSIANALARGVSSSVGRMQFSTKAKPNA